jgi:hypothetical protein
MAQPYSKETRDLLDRAQRAINESIELREESRHAILKGRSWQVELELRLSRERIAAS